VYPVTLEVKGRRVLVVGGGSVALRKVQGLVDGGARVTVVAPQVVDGLTEMANREQIELWTREYSGDADQSWSLIFAATDDREINARVFHDAEEAGVWCNVADDPELCSFHLPARVRRGPLQIAIGSAGEAPFAVRRLRQLFERRIGSTWCDWLASAARFRDAVRAHGVSSEVEETLFDRFFEETVDEQQLTVRVPTASEEHAWLKAPIEHRTITERKRDTEAKSDGMGLVSLIGAGPGCPGLLTVRGKQRLFEADAVVFDRLAAPALPPDLALETELHSVGKVAGYHPVPQGEINELLVRLSRSGKRVARFKGGDPYVFGRGGEEAEVLAAKGIPFEIVPGVTSGVAAMAWSGVPATFRREAVRLTLFTAHESAKEDGPQLRWDLLAQDEHATLVGYMGVSALPRVVANLVKHGMDPSTPAAMVEQGTTSAQRRVISSLLKLPEAVEAAGLKPPALFAFGPTVRHAETLDWISRLPLAGHRLVIVASHARLARGLEEAGAEVVMLPTPVTPAARVVMGALPLSGCVVCTAAEVECLDAERTGQGWGDGTAAWCVGAEAAERANERGWSTVFELPADVGLDALVDSIVG
jgi:uroporphyrin-III C-methyltransferase/precorrin-2 dehydrogenase/sirohydrochlorin ferrochelatase